MHGIIWFFRPGREGKEFGHDIFEKLLPISSDLLAQAEQDEIRLHRIEHVPLKLDQEEIKKITRSRAQYSETFKNMNTKKKQLRETSV